MASHSITSKCNGFFLLKRIFGTDCLQEVTHHMIVPTLENGDKNCSLSIFHVTTQTTPAINVLKFDWFVSAFIQRTREKTSPLRLRSLQHSRSCSIADLADFVGSSSRQCFQPDPLFMDSYIPSWISRHFCPVCPVLAAP